MYNLLPSKYKEKSVFDNLFNFFNMDVLLTIFLIISLLAVLPTTQKLSDMEVDQYSQELELVQRKIRTIRGATVDLNQLKEEFEGQIDEIFKRNELTGFKYNWHQILQEIKNITPENMWFEELTIDERGSFNIVGYVLENEDLIRFRGELSKSTFFNEVNLFLNERADLPPIRPNGDIIKRVVDSKTRNILENIEDEIEIEVKDLIRFRIRGVLVK